MPPISLGTPKKKDHFKHFWSLAEMIHTLETRSFRSLDLEKIIQAGLKGMANAVDAHSSFFTPQSYKETVNFASGQFPGIGVSIINKEVDEETLLIVDTIPGSPAFTAGLLGGDKIVEVDNESLRGLSSDEVATKLKGGAVGSTVSLKVIRDKKPLSFTVTRNIIEDRSCYSYFFPEHATTYIAIKSFNERTASQVKKFLTDGYTKHISSVILDLRRNPGGVLESAVETAGLFTQPQTEIVSTRTSDKKIHACYHTKTKPIHPPHIPIFILTDNFTASAAEILAGSLRQCSEKSEKHDLLVFTCGTESFGKGSVQEIMPLSNGCALKLTTLLYYLPNNTCLQAHGIAPDFLCKPKHVPHDHMLWVEGLYGKEKSLKNHITREEVTGDKLNPEPSSKNKNKTRASSDLESTKKQMSPEEIESHMEKTISEDTQIRFALSLCNSARAELSHKKQSRSALLKTLKSRVIGDEAIKIERCK